jgi:hypothetical protein
MPERPHSFRRTRRAQRAWAGRNACHRIPRRPYRNRQPLWLPRAVWPGSVAAFRLVSCNLGSLMRPEGAVLRSAHVPICKARGERKLPPSCTPPRCNRKAAAKVEGAANRRSSCAADRRTTCLPIASLIAQHLNRTIGRSPILCGAICLLAAPSLTDPAVSGFVRAQTAS